MIRISLSLILMAMVMVEAAAETRTLNFTDFDEVASCLRNPRFHQARENLPGRCDRILRKT